MQKVEQLTIVKVLWFIQIAQFEDIRGICFFDKYYFTNRGSGKL